MRIKVIGENDCARSLRGLLRAAGFAVTEFLPAEAVLHAPVAGYVVRLEESNTAQAIGLDSVDCALEANILRHITRLSSRPVALDRAGGEVHSDSEIRIVVPAGHPDLASAVELGVVRGLLDTVETRNAKLETRNATPAARRGGWLRRILPLIALAAFLPGILMLPPTARAQVQQKIGATRIAEGAALPATCDPSAPDDANHFFYKTTSPAQGLYSCVALNTWSQGPASSGPHALLGATHTDTTAAAVARGAMVTGQGATPSWSLLPLGLAGQCLTSNGADAVWGSCGGAAANHNLLSATHPDTTAAAVVRGALVAGLGATPSWSLLSPGAAGQVLLSGGAGADPAWGDPIVSGPDAPGAAPTRNPVQIGAFDGVNVQRVSSDAAGRLNVNVANSPAVNAAQSGAWSVSIGAALPAGANTIGAVKRTDGTNTATVDPCQDSALTRASFVINQTAGAQLITGAAAKQTYICSLFYVTATAQNIALVEGTGTVCATGTAGMAGGASVATGQNWAANSGFTNPATGYWQFKTATAADNVCLLQSGTGQISGTGTFVQK